ncbi:helix-turn-helix transcriptional regulator [bacterium SCSIO 12643]|nr:helix-turn-helix transcriptional regulator [bacterium SCSIO 12643]
MQYKKIQPNQALNSVVDHFWFFQVEKSDLPFQQTLFPFGRFELFFELNGEHKVFFSGHLKNTVSIVYTEPFKAVGVSLNAWSADFLMQIPMVDFSSKTTDISDISEYRDVSDMLHTAQNEEEIIDVLEKSLFQKIERYQTDPISLWIAHLIKNNTDLTLDQFDFSKIGLSRRRIEQKFVTHTGVSMGKYLGLSRFEKALIALERSDQSDLTTIGLDLGYYDQSHFIRKFKGYSGVTPKQFMHRYSQIPERPIRDLMFL